jgi:predicted DNA-binding transcriptional regulator YafY
MIAYVHDLNKPDKTLLHRLSRIVEIDSTDEKYIEDASFDGNKYFKYSLGVFHKHAEEPIDVKLKVSGKGIIKLLLEDKIHPTQESLPINDHEIFLTIRVYNTPELENMVLGWGEYIEVIEPLSLREQMSKRIEAMFKLYN